MDSTFVAWSDSARAVQLLNQILPGLDSRIAAWLGALVAAGGVYLLEALIGIVRNRFPSQFALFAGVWAGFRWLINPLLGALLGKFINDDYTGGLMGYAGLRTLGAVVAGLAQTPGTMKKLSQTL